MILSIVFFLWWGEVPKMEWGIQDILSNCVTKCDWSDLLTPYSRLCWGIKKRDHPTSDILVMDPPLGVAERGWLHFSFEEFPKKNATTPISHPPRGVSMIWNTSGIFSLTTSTLQKIILLSTSNILEYVRNLYFSLTTSTLWSLQIFFSFFFTSEILQW